MELAALRRRSGTFGSPVLLGAPAPAAPPGEGLRTRRSGPLASPGRAGSLPEALPRQRSASLASPTAPSEPQGARPRLSPFAEGGPGGFGAGAEGGAGRPSRRQPSLPATLRGHQPDAVTLLVQEGAREARRQAAADAAARPPVPGGARARALPP